MRGWLVAITTVLVMAWLGVLVLANFNPTPTLPKASSSRFVPADGEAGRISLAGRPASVESARFSGLAVFSQFPVDLLNFSGPPAGESPSGVSWWRETVSPRSVSSGRGEPPGPTDPAADLAAAEISLRSVTTRGLLMHARTGTSTVAFKPALLELPGEVRPGATWSSSGRAMNAGRESDYTNTSSAAAPVDQRDAADGCLEVTSTTEVNRIAAREVNLWCPGAGMRSGRSGFGLPRRPFTGDWPQPGPAPEAVGPAAVQTAVEPARLVAHGDERPQPSPKILGSQMATTGSGVLFSTTITGGGLVASTAGPEGLVSRWWSKPRGAVQSLQTVGEVLLVTSSDRRLLAYAADGRRLWSIALPDLAPGGVVQVGPDRIALVTVTGALQLHSLQTGEVLWRQQVEAGSSQAPVLVEDLLVVLGKDQSITAVGLDGAKRWSNDDLDMGGLTVLPGIPGQLELVSPQGSLVRLSRTTGEAISWKLIAYTEAPHTAVRLGERTVVVGRAGARFFDPRGEEQLQLPGVIDVEVGGDGFWMTTADALLRTDAEGRVLGRTPLAKPVSERAKISLSNDRVWVLDGGDVQWVQ